MKTITKYQAYDGSEFTNPIACTTYEQHSRAADAIIAQLPPTPEDDGCEFANGGGYIQHDTALVLKVRRELLTQAAKETDHPHIKQSLESTSVHPSWAHRVIDECCTNRLAFAWLRIACIDKDSREWGQCYYAWNPGTGKDIRINP